MLPLSCRTPYSLEGHTPRCASPAPAASVARMCHGDVKRVTQPASHAAPSDCVTQQVQNGGSTPGRGTYVGDGAPALKSPGVPSSQPPAMLCSFKPCNLFQQGGLKDSSAPSLTATPLPLSTSVRVSQLSLRQFGPCGELRIKKKRHLGSLCWRFPAHWFGVW